MDTPFAAKALLGTISIPATLGGGYYAFKHIDWAGKSNTVAVDNGDTFTGGTVTLTKTTETQKYSVEKSAPENDGYLYMLVNPQNITTDKVSTTQLFTTVSSNKHGNYKCKANDLVDYTCEIKKIDLDSKKQYTLPTDPSTDFKADDNITNDEVVDSKKIFLLKIKKSLFSKSNNVFNDIDILPINPSTTPDEITKKFAQLKPIFVKSKTKTFGEANYLLIKPATAVTTGEMTSNSSAEFKCKLSLASKEIFNTDCYVNKFSDNATNEDYKQETLSDNLTPTDQLVAKKNYLLAKKDSTSFDIENIKKDSGNLSVTLTTISSSATKTVNTESVKFAYLNNTTGADWIAIVE